MKAFLLAAGEGTRLRPLTNTLPKCLIPIHGKPLLGIWIELFDKFNIWEVLINTHHHATKVEQFIKNINTNVQITTSYERKLLGSGGTVYANRNFITGCGDFIIAYADNLTNINLSKLISFHRSCRSKEGVLTMGLMRTSDPRSCGIVVLDKENRIVKFTEKPEYPESDLANGGIYIASQKIFDFFPDDKIKSKDSVFDLGYHLFPALAGKMFGYEIKEYIRDIGNIESYNLALKEWNYNR